MSRQHHSQLLLVPGAWYHSDLLAPLIRAIRRYGWQVHTPTIAGHRFGEAARNDITVADMVESIRSYVDVNDLADLTVYAHSAGGVLLTQLAPLIRPRLRRLVFHNAFIPQSGNRLRDELPPTWELMLDQVADRLNRTVTLPAAVWREAFMQDTDLATANAFHARLVPEPLAIFETVLDQDAFFALVEEPDPAKRLPMSYVYATGDIALPVGFIPGLDDQPVDGWGWYPRYARRLGMPRVIEIPGTSHNVAVTNPRLLAKAIHAAARD